MKNNTIEVTNMNLQDLVKTAYALSVPMGMGFMHAKEGPLSDADAEHIIQTTKRQYRDNYDGIAVSMDYVHGRACKFTVRENKDGRYIYDEWFDHTDKQLRNLLDICSKDN